MSNSLIHGLCCHHPALVSMEAFAKSPREMLGLGYLKILRMVGLENWLMDEIDERVERVVGSGRIFVEGELDTRKRMTAYVGKQRLDGGERCSLTAPAPASLRRCRHYLQTSRYDPKVLPYSPQQVISDLCICTQTAAK